MRGRLLTSVVVALLTVGMVFAQNDRRDRQNPELIVESGGRLGSCDKIQFTSDGQYLLAIGDDKVVRIWPYRDGKLQMDGMRVLRWGIWREQRGAIFALALSPDPENSYVAIAGLGQPTSTVAILERTTGKMVHRVVASLPNGNTASAMWSLAYAPDGNRIAFGDSEGGVWTWDFMGKAKRLEGSHSEPGKSNPVRFVHFFKDGTLVSIAEDGSVRKWDDSKKPGAMGKTEKPFDTGGSGIFRVTLSPDEKWYAVAAKKQKVILRPVDGKLKDVPISLPNELLRAVAFDTKKERLAVSIGGSLGGDNPFLMESADRIDFYDLKGNRIAEGPRGLFRAWYIAFHPDGKDVAIAAGENHEVTLWNLAKMDQPVSVISGAGKCLWSVALSKDGNQIAFRDQRNPQSVEPNDRGQGPWRVFHLLRREWTSPADFKAVEQYPRWEGWSVRSSKESQFIWYAVTPNGRELPLPLNEKLDGMPRCYTFLPPADDRSLRLAVGHLWGLSIFELTPTAVKRVRLCTGHQADVTALAASADGSFLVSASMDQTISGWNLANNWPTQPLLGASFEIKNDRFFVKKVDVGSPAWEAGLVAGDEVKSFHFGGDPQPFADGRKAAWLVRLQDPVPGTEFGFRIRRGDKPEFSLGTTIRQRPLWRFFPTRDNEWVLWMWQNSYYDTSTKGDSYIGWHVNAPDLAHEPAFYRAEQFRKIYERPDVLDKLLLTKDVQAALREALGANPLPPKFNATEPPLAALKLAATTENQDVDATLTVTPHGDNPDFQPARTELWINDFRLEEDKHPEKWGKSGEAFRKVLTIPNAKLRAGKNVLTFQVYNRVGGRAEKTEILTCTRPAPPPRLFGFAVGVNDYGAIKVGPGGRGKLGNLTSACNDAEAIQTSWQSQKTLYTETKMLLYPDAKAKRANILNELDQLAKKVGPEDRCIIFLAGHGLFVKHEGTKEQPPRTTWLFCCPDYDATRPEETCITSEVLYGKLAAIAGRKLVILDACHSGEAAANPVRSLVPGGQGPIIIASCDRNQSSYEDDKKLKHGLFTYALLEALGEKFAIAANGNKELDAEQLFQYTRGRMPKLLKDVDANEFAQVPILFKPPEQLFPIAKAKVAKAKE